MVLAEAMEPLPTVARASMVLLSSNRGGNERALRPTCRPTVALEQGGEGRG
jgi:hypothetical protein